MCVDRPISRVVETHHVITGSRQLTAEIVRPADHLHAQAHHQQYARLLRVAEGFVFDPQTVGLDVWRHVVAEFDAKDITLAEAVQLCALAP